MVYFISTEYSESYRSGHNEAVLKTVWEQSRVGSNPTLSANKKENFCLSKVLFSFNLVAGEDHPPAVFSISQLRPLSEPLQRKLQDRQRPE